MTSSQTTLTAHDADQQTAQHPTEPMDQLRALGAAAASAADVAPDKAVRVGKHRRPD